MTSASFTLSSQDTCPRVALQPTEDAVPKGSFWKTRQHMKESTSPTAFQGPFLPASARRSHGVPPLPSAAQVLEGAPAGPAAFTWQVSEHLKPRWLLPGRGRGQDFWRAAVSGRLWTNGNTPRCFELTAVYVLVWGDRCAGVHDAKNTGAPGGKPKDTQRNRAEAAPAQGQQHGSRRILKQPRCEGH